MLDRAIYFTNVLYSLNILCFTGLCPQNDPYVCTLPN
uniref:Uncharacterized protein n=1 Tax=Anguilla anguilla TaxID=7936 RepID=A0A0E9Q8I0_ANGAN